MKQKKLIFNFFVNRNWKKLTDSRKRAEILADNRKSHHPIETLFQGLEYLRLLSVLKRVSCFKLEAFSRVLRLAISGLNLQNQYFFPKYLFPRFKCEKLLASVCKKKKIISGSETHVSWSLKQGSEMSISGEQDQGLKASAINKTK